MSGGTVAVGIVGIGATAVSAVATQLIGWRREVNQTRERRSERLREERKAAFVAYLEQVNALFRSANRFQASSANADNAGKRALMHDYVDAVEATYQVMAVVRIFLAEHCGNSLHELEKVLSSRPEGRVTVASHTLHLRAQLPTLRTIHLLIVAEARAALVSLPVTTPSKASTAAD